MLLLEHKDSATKKNVKFIYSTAISLSGTYHTDNFVKVHEPRFVINVIGSGLFKWSSHTMLLLK